MPRVSLKVKVTALVASLVTLSVLVIGVSTYMRGREVIASEQLRLHAALAEVKAAHLRGLLAQVDATLQAVSGSDALRGSGADKEAMLSRTLRDQQSGARALISRLMVADSAGQVIAASDRSLIGKRIGDLWRGTELSPRYVLGPESTLTILPMIDRPALASAKTCDLGASVGAVVAYLNWQGITEQVLGAYGNEAERDSSFVALMASREALLGVSRGLEPEKLWTARGAMRLQDLGIVQESGTLTPGSTANLFMDKHRYQTQTVVVDRDLGWTLVAAGDLEFRERAGAGVFMGLVTSMILASVICIILGFIVASRISSSMAMLLPSFAKLAAGDLDCTIQCDTGDEIEDLARYFNDFVTKLRQVVANIVASTQTLSESSHLLADLSQNLVSNAHETSSQASSASKISDEVSTNINTVSAGVEEMSLSINEIARSSDEAARVATSAVRIAEMTNTTVAELGGSSSEIGNVIKVINSIAEQTNLLALNATIEAARAGEAGKGFAVVANEVKELAKETARATEDIGKKIEAIQAKTKGAVSAIGEIGSIINQVNDYQTTIASAVQEQLATTTEIGRNIAEVAERSYMITKNISTVAQIAQSASTGANDTQSATGDVSRIAADLHILVEKFRYSR
jgi:methyl-accepting chemotaxis protein